MSFQTMMNRNKKNDDNYDKNRDFFQTPPDAIEKLLEREYFGGTIVDPCCGTGTIPKAIIKRVPSSERYVNYADIVDRGYPGTYIADFLETWGMWLGVDHVICNPPYKHAEEFFHKAWNIAEQKIALLLRLMWLEGQKRHETIFSVHPPRRVYVFSYRLSFTTPKDGNRKAGGMTPYAWFVWDKDYNRPGMSHLEWIDK